MITTYCKKKHSLIPEKEWDNYWEPHSLFALLSVEASTQAGTEPNYQKKSKISKYLEGVSCISPYPYWFGHVFHVFLKYTTVFDAL